MERKVIVTPEAPAPVGPYNQAIVAQGQMVFVAGQVALDPSSGQLVGETVADQTRQAMANMKAILAAAGATLDNVVKTSVFLQNMDDFAAMNEVYGQYFDDETAPARACVQVARLPKGALVEVECMAVL